MALLGSVSAAGDAACGISVVVRTRSTPDWFLEFALTNETSEPLTFYRHALPWVGYYSILLVAVRLDSMASVLERSTPVDDPVTGSVTIQPAQVLTGEIILRRHFPSFAAALAERDVIIFWSCQVTPIDRNPLPRLAGAVLFPGAISS